MVAHHVVTLRDPLTASRAARRVEAHTPLPMPMRPLPLLACTAHLVPTTQQAQMLGDREAVPFRFQLRTAETAGGGGASAVAVLRLRG